MSKLEEMMHDVSDKIGAKRVYAEPYEKNGVTVIAAAAVMGGAGGGEGTAPTPANQADAGAAAEAPAGVGGGFGVSARPIGAFVIRGNEVEWLPAVDVNRIVFGMQIVMVVFFLVLRSIVKTRAQARIKAAGAK